MSSESSSEQEPRIAPRSAVSALHVSHCLSERRLRAGDIFDAPEALQLRPGPFRLFAIFSHAELPDARRDHSLLYES
jgi:hypothetical protein